MEKRLKQYYFNNEIEEGYILVGDYSYEDNYHLIKDIDLGVREGLISKELGEELKQELNTKKTITRNNIIIYLINNGIIDKVKERKYFAAKKISGTTSQYEYLSNIKKEEISEIIDIQIPEYVAGEIEDGLFLDDLEYDALTYIESNLKRYITDKLIDIILCSRENLRFNKSRIENRIIKFLISKYDLDILSLKGLIKKLDKETREDIRRTPNIFSVDMFDTLIPDNLESVEAQEKWEEFTYKANLNQEFISLVDFAGIFLINNHPQHIFTNLILATLHSNFSYQFEEDYRSKFDNKYLESINWPYRNLGWNEEFFLSILQENKETIMANIFMDTKDITEDKKATAKDAIDLCFDYLKKSGITLDRYDSEYPNFCQNLMLLCLSLEQEGLIEKFDRVEELRNLLDCTYIEACEYFPDYSPSLEELTTIPNNDEVFAQLPQNRRPGYSKKRKKYKIN